MKTTQTLKASVRAERVQRLTAADDFFKGNMETSDWGGRGRKGREGGDAEAEREPTESRGERETASLYVMREGRLSLLSKATLSSLS